MPNHTVHEVSGLVTAPFIFTGSLLLMPSIDYAVIATSLYIAATYLLSPDLDTHSAPYYRWNFLSLFWYPYMRLIPHRSWLSHSGPISATIRFGYLLGCVYIIQTLLQTLLFPDLNLLTYHSFYAILWITMALVDSLHCILDWTMKGG